ncbi:ABC transporter ATP-binding protein [Mycobacterium sp. C31M]
MTGDLAATGVTWSVKERRLLDAADLHAASGQLVGLLGPNGSGKTTFLRVLAGLRAPHAGGVTLDGTDLFGMGRRAVSRRMAVVEQDTFAHTDLSVRQVVEIGRTPFRGRFDALSAVDLAAIDDALQQVDLVTLQHRSWQSLSGGERQRAQLARALAQHPTEILLDEPTNHLDIRHQIELLELLRSLDATCVIALHDLNLAARYCDRLVVLDGGVVAAAGPSQEVLTVDLLARVYGVDAIVERDEQSGSVRVVFRGTRR